MAKVDLLLEFMIVPFNPPSQLGLIDEVGELGIFRQGREPVLGRLDLALRPLDQEPFLNSWCGAPVVEMGWADADGGKALGERRLGALALGDAAPGVFGQGANSLAETGACPGWRQTSEDGRPRPLHGLGGSGCVPGDHRADRGLDTDDLWEAHLRQLGAQGGGALRLR
ncbi:hypothetical protein BFX40_10775 [Mesorhizobium sp. SEMIA 3007]|nr:hypothetical protein BFX40_10775 [Mesorhizobium sp. SEMIA 3007]